MVRHSCVRSLRSWNTLRSPSLRATASHEFASVGAPLQLVLTNTCLAPAGKLVKLQLGESQTSTQELFW